MLFLSPFRENSLKFLKLLFFNQIFPLSSQILFFNSQILSYYTEIIGLLVVVSVLGLQSAGGHYWNQFPWPQFKFTIFKHSITVYSFLLLTAYFLLKASRHAHWKSLQIILCWFYSVSFNWSYLEFLKENLPQIR